MSDRITLQGMRFEGRHGVSDEERAFPQPLEVDLVVEADLSNAARSDALSDTIDYGQLVEVCRAVVEDGDARLLEAVAGAIIERVLGASPAIHAVTARVRKLAVPVDADLDHAQVELRRERSGPATAVPAASPG